MRGGLHQVLALATAVAAAGCISGGGPVAEGPDVPEAEAAATEETTTGDGSDPPASPPPPPPPPSVEERPPTKAEVAWVGRLVSWSLAIAGPVETASGAIDTLRKEMLLNQKYGRQVDRALADVKRCRAAYFQTVGPPPSERLEVSAAAARDACELYAEGAANAQRHLRYSLDKDALEQWAISWQEANRLVEATSHVFVDYQPSNRTKLPKRKGVTNASRVEPVFGRAATAAVPRGAFDRRVEARCWSRQDWQPLLREMGRWSDGRVSGNLAGFAGYADHRVNLAPDVCEHLVALRYRGARPPAGTEEHALIAFSVNVLMHEAEHARGVVNEAAAECYSMQRIRKAARLLGADGPYADSLADVYWRLVYPHVHEDYRSPECRNGGALDAFPRQDHWP